jgi:hypothetical protein
VRFLTERRDEYVQIFRNDTAYHRAIGDGPPFASPTLKWLQVSQLRSYELIRLLIVEESEDVIASLRQLSTSDQPFCDLRER